MIDLKAEMANRFIDESAAFGRQMALGRIEVNVLAKAAMELFEKHVDVKRGPATSGVPQNKKLVQVSDTDADGHRRPDKFVGKRYFHPKTGRIYCVDAFGVDSQRDLWVLLYSCENTPLPNDFDDLEEFRLRNGSDPINRFVHTIGDFTREGRFLEVKS